jgi:hypothetical protein
MTRIICRCYKCQITQSFEIEAGASSFRVCPACKKMMVSTPVKGKYNPNHKCNAKCTNAISGVCDCSCGGANHGIGHAA